MNETVISKESFIMLSTSEKIGLKTILQDLDDLDLFILCDSISHRMIRTQDRQEAIDGIISCIQKPSELLNRKKITKPILFNYLRKRIGSVSPSSSKIDLVMKCLEEWKCTEISPDMECEETEIMENRCTNTLQLMGIQFIEWFFPLYNQLQDFDEKHFWQDVVLKVDVSLPSEKNSLTKNSDTDVSRFLASLIVDYKLYFHPNESSVGCQEEVHGMVKIQASGILHQLNNPVGTFDFNFLLIRNPACDNNWKIKFIQLRAQAYVSLNNALPYAITY